LGRRTRPDRRDVDGRDRAPDPRPPVAERALQLRDELLRNGFTSAHLVLRSAHRAALAEAARRNAMRNESVVLESPDRSARDPQPGGLARGGRRAARRLDGLRPRPRRDRNVRTSPPYATRKARGELGARRRISRRLPASGPERRAAPPRSCRGRVLVSQRRG